MRRATLLLLGLSLVAMPGLASAGPPRADLAAMWLAGDDIEATGTADAASSEEYIERDLRVQVWHDKADDDVYQRGEPISIHFTTNADLYVVVYRIDADGYASILWPTSRYDDGFVYGGHTYTVPSGGTDQRLYASRSKGVEYVEAIASRYPFDLRELAIDFAFDRHADVRYDYAVAGDPFLAVNDINYAITGLEEDTDFVVTAWTHLYVESRVDYPRYTCTQCHTDGDDHHPYVDTCTRVVVYHDYGWQNSWYVRFGWYPLYYEPPFYYWDTVLYRPYWYWYYPVCYSWPWYPVYYRPYPIHYWHDSPCYRGDYWVRYRRGATHSSPLYDVAPPTTGRGIRDDRSTRGAVPSSIVQNGGRGDRSIDRIPRDQLVRSDPSPRSRGELGVAANAGRVAGAGRVRQTGSSRTGIRIDAPRRSRTIVAQSPPQTVGARGDAGRQVSPSSPGGEARTAGARRWTRPVVRNVDRGGAAREPGTVRQVPQGQAEPRSVQPRATQRDGSADSRRVQPQPRTARQGGTDSPREGRVAPPPTRRDEPSGSSGTVRRSTGGKTADRNKGGGSASRPSVAPSRSSRSSGSARAPRPATRSSRGTVSRSSSSRGTVNRSSGSRGTVNRSSGSRGTVNRSSGSRGTVNRSSSSRGTVNRSSGRSGAAASRGSSRGGGSRGSGGGSRGRGR